MSPSLSSGGPHLRPWHVSSSLADMHTARHLNPVDGRWWGCRPLQSQHWTTRSLWDSEWCAGLCGPCRRVAPLLHERLIYLWVNSNFNLQVLGAVRRPVPGPLSTTIAALLCGGSQLMWFRTILKSRAGLQSCLMHRQQEGSRSGMRRWPADHETNSKISARSKRPEQNILPLCRSPRLPHVLTQWEGSRRRAPPAVSSGHLYHGFGKQEGLLQAPNNPVLDFPASGLHSALRQLCTKAHAITR